MSQERSRHKWIDASIAKTEATTEVSPKPSDALALAKLQDQVDDLYASLNVADELPELRNVSLPFLQTPPC